MSSKKEQQKSVLNLALELGVRTETVLQAMRDMGLSADEWTTFDADEESTIIEHMVINGAVSSSLAKGKRRRKPTEEPIVDDDLLTEALGSSENGFSDSNIPRQIQFESGFEKKSLMQKWFGKKNDIAISLKKNPFDEDAVESMFSEPIEIDEDRELSPFQEIERQSVQLQTPVEESRTRIDEEEIEEPETGDAELTEGELEGFDDLEIDEDLLGNMQDIEVEENESVEEGGTGGVLDEIAAEDLEDLGDLTEEDLEGVELEDMEVEAGEEGDEGVADEELDVDLDETGLGDLALEGDEEGAAKEGGLLESKEEEYVPGFIEKVFSRIHLSPAEMWALMAGSVVTMLFLLGITVYWWLYTSPRALENILVKADNAYAVAIDYETQWQKGRVPWKKTKSSYQAAIDLYKEYIDKYPEDLQIVKLAYKNMCDCYYRIAIGDKKEGNKEESQNAFRQMATFYEKFLELYDAIANLNVGADKAHLAYPDVEEQRLALYRIAVAKRELEQFEQTIKSLKEFVARYRDTEEALDSMTEIGNSYQEWAKSKKDQELTLLGNAIDWYKKTLEKTPTDSYRRMMLFAKIGDVQYRLYEQNKQSDKVDEANQYLSEVIANYENAAEEAKKKSAEIEENPPEIVALRSIQKDIQHVRKKLGDLYLLRGEESGKEWKNYEDTAEPFPDSIAQKQQLLEAAKRERETTKRFLQQANDLYDQLLTQRELLDNSDFEDIIYNKTQSFYILREYPQALAAGDQLLNASQELSKDVRTKILYLLGNAAWEEAKESNDYSKVKDYYYKALEQDPLYPQEENGDTSHLADMRLINAYYLNDTNKDYPEAIKRYENMVKRYPESGYTYLTLFFYAKALEEYGDSLMGEAQKLRNDAETAGNATALLVQARQLEEKANEQYDIAVAQYNKAIESRKESKYVDTQNEQYLKQIMFNRGHCAFKEGKYREAEIFYKDAMTKYGNNSTAGEFKPLAVERLGDLNANLKSYDQAINYYKQYIDNAYDNPGMRITMKLADSYLKRYSWNEAREWYQKIINNDPLVPTDAQVEKRLRMETPIEKGPGYESLKKIAESYFREAQMYALEDRQPKMESALEAYKTFAQRYPLGASPDDRVRPADSDSLQTLGYIQFELGQYEDAAVTYEKFLAMNPTFSRKGQILYRIGQAYLEKQNFDKAIERLSEITQESLDNPKQYANALILLGQAYQKKANEFKDQSGDEGLYTRYLQRAQNTYNRVKITNQPQEMKEAITMSAAIDSEIRSREELAASTNNP